MNNPGNKVREQAISVDLSDIEQLRFELQAKAKKAQEAKRRKASESMIQ